jgi:hypothetical protein
MTARTAQLGLSSFLSFRKRLPSGGGLYYAKTYDQASNAWAPSGEYLIERGGNNQALCDGWHLSHTQQETVRVGENLVQETGTTRRWISHHWTYREAKEAAQADYDRLLEAPVAL